MGKHLVELNSDPPLFFALNFLANLFKKAQSSEQGYKCERFRAIRQRLGTLLIHIDMCGLICARFAACVRTGCDNACRSAALPHDMLSKTHHSFIFYYNHK